MSELEEHCSSVEADAGAKERRAFRSSVSRRGLIAGASAVAALAVVGGATKAFAGEGDLIYPPGGGDGQPLWGSCIRCGRCVGACPTGAIAPGTLQDGVINARVPTMNFRLGACDMCGGEFLCAANCPTGALGPFDPLRDKMGMAVVEPAECMLYGVSAHCNAPCIDACSWDALSLGEDGRLMVDEARCNGCGACEFACVTGSYGSYGGTGLKGINIVPWRGGKGDER